MEQNIRVNKIAELTLNFLINKNIYKKQLSDPVPLRVTLTTCLS